MMTPTKLPDRKPPRITLAIIDGTSASKNQRFKSQLKNTNGREFRTCEFLNTKDSVWSIIDTILGVKPEKSEHIRYELDSIRETLQTRSAPKPNRRFPAWLRGLLGFKMGFLLALLIEIRRGWPSVNTVTRFGWILTTFGPIVCHADRNPGVTKSHAGLLFPTSRTFTFVNLYIYPLSQISPIIDASSLVSAFLSTSGIETRRLSRNKQEFTIIIRVNKKRYFVVSESGHNDAACRQRGLCCSSISHLDGEVQHEVTLNLQVAGCQWAAPEIRWLPRSFERKLPTHSSYNSFPQRLQYNSYG